MNTTAQVGVGTTNPDDGSSFQVDSTVGAFIPPRMTNTQMNAIPTPLPGAVVFNTTAKSLFVFSNSVWKILSNPTLILNKAGGTISTNDNTYYNFIVGASDILLTDATTYSVTANGTITINRTGAYAISASFSTNNLPAGNHKYIIGAFRNGTLIGYLSRGFVTIPGTGSDYFGASGILNYYFNAGETLELRYVLNNGNTSVSAVFFNIGISKMD